jgi:hypothetical protein
MALSILWHPATAISLMLLVLLALSAVPQAGVEALKAAPIKACPSAPSSLFDVPDLPACRQLLALLDDPGSGCPDLKPVPDRIQACTWAPEPKPQTNGMHMGPRTLNPK